ncbi:hypothetical protein [Allosphingosinicella indica]|uniref:Uncharacterized protein n=1 Tax=Allosphingosinicella indica TaxID=941907 RepID=A0A1X7G162_9SPHN|nr:hypothetical protein [Allosphingosinicella indica]SMF61727.1 hypothetical protein SAMN06295910_0720 [Allosphingosinicella indica]
MPIEEPAPPPQKRPTSNILFMLALLLLVAGLAYWAIRAVPPATPDPTATAFPDRIPNAPPPPEQ